MHKPNGQHLILITLDTTELDRERAPRLETVLPKDILVAVVTVSLRERNWSPGTQSLAVILETGVWDESEWGNFVWGGTISEALVLDESQLASAKLDGDADLFEKVLTIISNGSFPPPGDRGNLAVGHRHAMRDAMIFSAHVRERRVLFITKDAKGFVNDGRRERLQDVGKTVIRSLEELEQLVEPNKFWDDLRALQIQLDPDMDEM